MRQVALIRQLPAKPFARLLREHFKATGEEHVMFELRTGVSARRIRALLAGGQDGINFNTADKIVCGTGNVQLWRSHQYLRRLYLGVDLSPKPSEAGERITIPPRECCAPGCVELFQPATEDRLYCSQRCQKNSWRQRRKEEA